MQNFLIFMQNHWMFSVAIIVVTFLLILIEYIRLRTGVQTISPREATFLLNRQNAVFIDIRPHEAFNAGHIAGSISLPLTDFETQIKKLEKYKNQPVVLVCTSGLESSKAAKILMTAHIKPFILAGGIKGWRDADMPLVKE